MQRINLNLERLEDLPPEAWLMLVGAIAFGMLLGWVWRWYRQLRARRAIVQAITSVGTDYVNDVLVPDGMGGSYHVDFLLLTPRGIVVVDLRDVRGNIFAGDQMNEWTVMDGPQRTTFVNPQSALYDRIAAVKALADDAPVEGRIVFTRRAKFPKGLPKWTLTIDSLRTEFPAVERAALASGGSRFESMWQNVKSSVTPSSLGARLAPSS
jgi:hypothetical protein